MADRASTSRGRTARVTLRHLNASGNGRRFSPRRERAESTPTPSAVRALRAAHPIRRGQSSLWGYGLSGDAPIVLLRISDGARIQLVQKLIQAHSYWRLKGLAVELGHLERRCLRLPPAVAGSDHRFDRVGPRGRRCWINPVASSCGASINFPTEDRVLLQTIARVVLVDENGTLAEQLDRPGSPDPMVPVLTPHRAASFRDPPAALPPRELVFNNGLGGFTPDGREYVITLQPKQTTPAPWVNVIANPFFGTVVSESGGLTPGSRTVTSSGSPRGITIPSPMRRRSVLFARRAERTILVAHAGAGPRRTPYVIRHGSATPCSSTRAWHRFRAVDLCGDGCAGEIRRAEIAQSFRPAAPDLRHRLLEWVLADLRSKSLLHVQTEMDPKSGALLASNPYSAEFAERIAFLELCTTRRAR